MENVTNIQVDRMPKDSPYVKPIRFTYTQNGKQKSRDVFKLHDSVSVVLFNVTRNVLLFVKQFRPAVYNAVTYAGDKKEIDTVKFPPKLGVTIELCAGMIDKNKSLVDIVREEIQEEVGYTVTNDRIEEIISFRTAVGRSGAKNTMFYCEVNDNDKSNDGGGIDDEIIDVVEYTIDDAKKLIQLGNYVNGSPTFLAGLLWFLNNKAAKFII